MEPRAKSERKERSKADCPHPPAELRVDSEESGEDWKEFNGIEALAWASLKLQLLQYALTTQVEGPRQIQVFQYRCRW